MKPPIHQGRDGHHPSFPAVDDAIRRTQAYLLSVHDRSEGFWVDELEADSTLTSEYIMLRRFLGVVDPAKEKKAVQYLITVQLPEGGWPIYYGGPSEISATVKAYFALKLAGVSKDEPFMMKAREIVLSKGGVVSANVFTKISLALFGQYDWRGIPTMPPEIILLPLWFPFNIYEISYWSRTVLVPLLIIFAKKPLCAVPKAAHIDELYCTRGKKHYRFKKSKSLFSRRNFFLTMDSLLKLYEKQPFPPLQKLYEKHSLPSLRQKAITKAKEWLLDHITGEGGLGAIYPAMANTCVALRCLGYPLDDPLVTKALSEIEQLEVEDDTTLHLQPCFSPIWDTSLTINALIESGFPRHHPALVKACRWLMSTQTTRRGDWSVKAPEAEPGGWYFQFENEFYPDNDDTAVVLLALAKVLMPEEEEKARAIERGLTWLLAMQCRDGGWGSFDVNNDKVFLNNIPFADHGALLDPSTADLAGRVLEVLGVLGYDTTFPPAARAIQFLKDQQEPHGSWYGRWGVNYIYGTWSVLAGLKSIGEDMRKDYVRRAVAWLKGCQNPDGGWGESCYSYQDPTTAGKGPSTASQTAWALLALLHAGETEDVSVRRGIRYLLSTQKVDGTWEEKEFTGTGFPRVFFLRYHMYCKYFPLWALSLYQSLRVSGRSRAEEIQKGSVQEFTSERR